MVNYFTAGVLVVIGIVLMVGFLKETKLFIPVGAICTLFGIWWGVGEFLPDDSPINGWVGVLIKVIVGATCVILFIILAFIQRREKAKFLAEQAAEDGEEAVPEGKKPLYEKYDDYDYEIEEIDESENSKEK